MGKKNVGNINADKKKLAAQLSYSMKIPIIYSIAGFIWISITEPFLIEIIEDKTILKGVSFGLWVVFVISTATLIFFLLKKDIKKIELYYNDLASKKEIYKSLYNSVAGGIIVQKPDQEIININSVACEIFGMEANKITGIKLPKENWYAIHEDGTRFEDDEYPHNVTFRKGTSVKNVVMGITNERTGEQRWILTNSEPIMNTKNGEIEAAMATFLDITDRKILQDKLKESEELYRNLFNEMSEGFALREVICDDNGKPIDYEYIDFNESYEKMIGMKKDQLIGNTILGIMPDFERDWIDIYGRVALTGEPVSFEKYSHDFGKYLKISAYCPEIGKFATVILDITERVNAEKEIKKLNEELENRVIERTAQLEASNKELEAFSYSVSHDLRAPLRAIEGFGKILEEDYGDKLDSEGMRFLNIIHKNTVQMGKLIDDLLSFSRMSRNNMGNETIEMNKLVKLVFDDLITSVGDREIILELKDLPCAMGDSSMIKQVLINLISNSIKFTRDREKAVIEVGCLKDENKNVYYIKDNGIGFDMKYVDKLFGVFQRLHRAEEYEGTGIGLALVQRIIRRHGGNVWAEGRPNEGTTIYFILD